MEYRGYEMHPKDACQATLISKLNNKKCHCYFCLRTQLAGLYALACAMEAMAGGILMAKYMPRACHRLPQRMSFDTSRSW